MKRILAILAVVALVVSPVLAVEKAVAPGGAKHPLKDLTLKGTITKTEVDKKVTFTLETADGKIVLPAPKDGIGEDLLNVDVTVVAKGSEIEKEGKKVVKVKEVVSIKKAEAAKEEVKKEEPKKEEAK